LEWTPIRDAPTWQTFAGTKTLNGTTALELTVEGNKTVTQPAVWQPTTQILYGSLVEGEPVLVTPESGSYKIRVEYRKEGDPEWTLLGEESGGYTNSVPVKTYKVEGLDP